MSSLTPQHWTGETDLLIIGAGAGGMTAALIGALEGLRVVLCEKSDMVGGTTATSAGSVWIPGSRQSAAAGLSDTIDAARQYLRALLGSDSEDERLQAYLDSGPAMLDDLARRSTVVFTPPPVHPDYRDLPGAATGGRALSAQPFDGRCLGADFARVRPPRRAFMVLGGMMVGKTDIPALMKPFGSWRNLSHVLALLARHGSDRLRFHRGTRLLMGNALVGRLLYDLKRLAVDIRYQTTLKELVRDGDDVVGAILDSPCGEQRITARRGVVLASGGIGWSRPLRERLFPDAARRYSLAPAGNTGDGIAAGECVGGEIDLPPHGPALWMPSSVMPREDGEVSVFPHIMLDRAKPGLLAIDRNGRRFVNEADSYHDVVQAMLGDERERVPAHLICDGSFIRDFGIGLVHPGTRNLGRFIHAGYLVEADSLAALAAKVGVDGETLARTISRYNASALTGVDDEFGRGKSPLNRFNGDPGHRPNPCLRPIGPGPYYAVAVWPSDLANSAGLRTDANARVLQAGSQQPLRGLYAVGNDASSIFRGTYPGPGTMIGPAMVFAWRAALDAAGRLDRHLKRGD